MCKRKSVPEGENTGYRMQGFSISNIEQGMSNVKGEKPCESVKSVSKKFTVDNCSSWWPIQIRLYPVIPSDFVVSCASSFLTTKYPKRAKEYLPLPFSQHLAPFVVQYFGWGRRSRWVLSLPITQGMRRFWMPS